MAEHSYTHKHINKKIKMYMKIYYKKNKHINKKTNVFRREWGSLTYADVYLFVNLTR